MDSGSGDVQGRASSGADRTGTETQSEGNPYLEMRAAKIARNRRKLQSLGLLESSSSRSAASSSSSPSSSCHPPPSSSRSSQNGTSREDRRRELALLPRRTSRRLAGVEIPSYREVSSALTEQPSSRRTTANPRKRARGGNDDAVSPADDASVGVTAEQPTAAGTKSSKPSSRTTEIHVGAIVDRHLGREVDVFGKAAVVEEAVRATREEEVEDVADDSTPHISFNKYSGVCEWRNDAIFLWVNIANPGADVVNDFLDGGKQMTWFGGARMHDDTPAIKRLIQVGRNAAAVAGRPSSSQRNGIVLWCRVYDKEKRGFRPYACLGRVSYHSHVPGTRPIQFVWNLLDFDALRSEHGAALEEFMNS